MCRECGTSTEDTVSHERSPKREKRPLQLSLARTECGDPQALWNSHFATCATDRGHRSTGLNVCSAEFQSYIGLVIFYFHIPFQNGNYYDLYLDVPSKLHLLIFGAVQSLLDLLHVTLELRVCGTKLSADWNQHSSGCGQWKPHSECGQDQSIGYVWVEYKGSK